MEPSSHDTASKRLTERPCGAPVWAIRLPNGIEQLESHADRTLGSDVPCLWSNRETLDRLP